MKLIIFLLSITSLNLSYANSCIMESYQDEVTDTANSLAEIAQENLLKGQCKIYHKEFRRRSKSKTPKLTERQYNRAKVLCGKDMFINLNMRTNIGIPVILLKGLENFDGVGKKLNKLGFLNDESWEKKRWPFGIVKAKHKNRFQFKRTTTNKIVQISCAACHTGQLPDGRISLGMTNEKLKYGELNKLTLFAIWLADKRKYDETRWYSGLIKEYKKLDKLNKSFFLKTMKPIALMPFNETFLKHAVGEEPPTLAAQKSFLESAPGIFNGFAPSISFKDREHYTSAPSIWEFGKDKESQFGTLAGKKSPSDFVKEAFIYTNRTNKYNTKEYVEPIAEYLKCLKAPKHEVNLNIKAKSGKEIFKNSCKNCHDLPNGGGSLAIDAKEMGIPNSFLNIFDKYEPVSIQSRVTYNYLKEFNLVTTSDKVKVRRLKRIWSRKNLTSNGQIQGLEHLFCINGKERKIIDPNNSKTQGIHNDLCEDYNTYEKESLIEYLKTL